VPKSASRRTNVNLPVDLVADIDKLVGKRGRSAFLTEVARDEIQRRLQREALREAAGAWKDEDHPELKDGAAAWVRQLRALDNQRFEDLERRRSGR
jgi:Arc/MetJ-type ribon-helix-helix transcriptional regulator